MLDRKRFGNLRMALSLRTTEFVNSALVFLRNAAHSTEICCPPLSGNLVPVATHRASADGNAGFCVSGRRCFVSNLNWKTSWQDLKDKFRECGEVVYANVVRDEDGESPSCWPCSVLRKHN